MEDEPPIRRWNTKAIRYWTIAFALNLPLPLMLAPPFCTNNWGWAGIALACLCLYAIGFYVAGCGYSFLRHILRGSWIVAAFQFVPVIQFIAGLIALSIWEQGRRMMGLGNQDFPFFNGYAVTLLVGQILLLTSLAIGLVLHLVYRFHTSEEAWWPR